MKISKKYIQMSEVYIIFTQSLKMELDFSRECLEEMFLFESKGEEIKNKNNGFYWGKKHMDITISMWNKDLKSGTLFRKELYEDGTFPHWFLDKVLK